MSMSDVSDIETVKRSRMRESAMRSISPTVQPSPAAKTKPSLRESMNCSPVMQALRNSNHYDRAELMKEFDRKIQQVEYRSHLAPQDIDMPQVSSYK